MARFSSFSYKYLSISSIVRFHHNLIIQILILNSFHVGAFEGMSHNGQVMENFVPEACQEMISILITEIENI